MHSTNVLYIMGCSAFNRETILFSYDYIYYRGLTTTVYFRFNVRVAFQIPRYSVLSIKNHFARLKLAFNTSILSLLIHCSFELMSR